jgi:hypothetical protein
MSKVVQLRRRARVIVPDPKEPPMLELAELYAMREEALQRGDMVRVGEIERMAKELLDGNDW